MELKYTIEILTKDIQDIEKLVGNLQNYTRGSTLELDLALSKLRNVYDILTVIRSDMELERGKSIKPQAEAKQEPEPEAQAAPETMPEPLPEPVPEPEAQSTQEPAQEPKTQSAPVPEPEKEMKSSPKKELPKKPAGILAEKFEAESSINENLGAGRDKKMDTKIVGKPIDNIGRNIGINDRFLIIRELFENNGENFRAFIEKLDGSGSLAEANRILEEQFDDSINHEGIIILSNLIRRRYI